LRAYSTPYSGVRRTCPYDAVRIRERLENKHVDAVLIVRRPRAYVAGSLVEGSAYAVRVRPLAANSAVPRRHRTLLPLSLKAQTLATFLRERDASLESQNLALEISRRAERRVGELLSVPRPSWEGRPEQCAPWRARPAPAHRREHARAGARRMRAMVDANAFNRGSGRHSLGAARWATMHSS
jgi:hypothetical protein